MKKVIGSLVAVAGLAVSASAQPANTLLKYQVSSDGGMTWSSSVNVLPGTSVQVRAMVKYIGSAPITGGFGSMAFQPVVDDWTAADHLITNSDQGLAGAGYRPDGVGPYGGSRSTPVGLVSDASGAFGRVSPWGVNATSTSTYLRGHLGTGTAAGLLRIAQAHITNWIGVGATSGAAAANNWNGGGGVSVGQIASSARNGTDPEYSLDGSGNNTNEFAVVFKFGFTLSGATDSRTLDITTPANGIGRNTTAGANYGQQFARWFNNLNDPQANNTGGVSVMDAAVNVVPTPASIALLGLGGLVAARRRR